MAPDVRYSLQRLVRGLASGRKRARQGFFVALTEVSRDHVMLVYRTLELACLVVSVAGNV